MVPEATCTQEKLRNLWLRGFSCDWESQAEFQGDTQLVGNHHCSQVLLCRPTRAALQGELPSSPEVWKPGMGTWRFTSYPGTNAERLAGPNSTAWWEEIHVPLYEHSEVDKSGWEGWKSEKTHSVGRSRSKDSPKTYSRGLQMGQKLELTM